MGTSVASAYWITGDTLATLREMPAGSVDLVLTSPPFLALRSYLPADDPAKALEIGQEGTPGAFLDVLLDITEELRRVLAPHGSICVELGDTYSGSGGAGGDYAEGGLRDGQPAFRQSGWHRKGKRAEQDDQPPNYRRADDLTAAPIVNGGAGWPEAKSLCLIPELYRFALAYGFNPLTGRTTPRWRVRNVVRWVRPNPPVGALGDKFRPATSEMVIATMARDRFFDLDAVREPHKHPNATHTVGNVAEGRGDHGDPAKRIENHPGGAPPLDWWEIPTTPYKGSHYATYPPALCEKPIKAMSPAKVCRVCGEPSRRITSEPTYEPSATYRGGLTMSDAAKGDRLQDRRDEASLVRTVETLGWTDCGHDAWRPGRVLDIFGGSGTTLAVATGHGRDAIGIDLDQRNVDLARERIGPMFFHEVTVAELAEVLS